MNTFSSSRPEFSITLIGKTNSIEFNHWRQELLRVKNYLQNRTRKSWNMILTCQFCNEYEFENKMKFIQSSCEINKEKPIILTSQKAYSDLTEFYNKFLKLKLGITEMNKFKQMNLNEVEKIIILAIQESLQQQLKPNDSRNFAYFKLFDDDINRVFSILVQLNTVKCPHMIDIFQKFLGEGVNNSGQQITYLESIGFETGKNNFTGGLSNVAGYPPLKGLGFREELRQIQHEQGTFGLNIKDDAKGQVASIGLNFMLEKDYEFDQDSSLMMGLGHILYGYSEIKEYIQNLKTSRGDQEKIEINLRVVESGVYTYKKEDFINENSGQYKFKPNETKNQEYFMRKQIARQKKEEEERLIREEEERRIAEEKRLQEEEERKEEEERQEKKKQEEKAAKEKQKQLKEQRKEQGEDVTDSSDEDEEEMQDQVQPMDNNLGLQRQKSIGQSKSNALNDMGTQKTVSTGSTGETTELPTFALVMKDQSKIEEEKIQLEEIDEEYEIDEDNLQFLYELGKGSFGQVAVVINSDTKVRYARKVFSNIEDFVEERDLMHKLEKFFDGDLGDIGAGMAKYDNKSKTIYYDCGECSLHELMQVRRKYKVFWFDRESEIVYILSEVIKMFERMFEKKSYHSDLKPANIVLNKFITKNEYYLKLIDFGSVTFNYQEVKALTRDYYVPNIEQLIPIESEDKRQKLELYTLGRTIQSVMLSSIWEKENTKDRMYFDNNQEGIEESIQKLKAYYTDELVDIVQSLLFLEDVSGISEALKKLPGHKINDKENLIPRVLKMKQDEALQSGGETKANNIYEEMQQNWDNQLPDRGLQILNNKEKDEVDKDLRLVCWKIKFMKKIGNFALGQQYTKDVAKIVEIKEDGFRNTDDPDQKWAYYEFKQYHAWTFGINAGRFKKMDEVQKQIIEEYGEGSIQHAFSEFWYGWLSLGDRKYDQSLEHLQNSEKYYNTHFPNGDDLMIAEIYRYMAQDYYKLNEADKALEIYEKEAKIRKTMQGQNSGEYAVSLNSIASIYGHLKGDLQKGLDTIEQCLEIYYNSIGEKNQNFVIALDWKAWYLNQLKRKDEAKTIWEYCMVRALQVFGSNYHVFKTIRDSHLWNLYIRENVIQNIDQSFIVKSQELYKIEDYQESLDFVEAGQHMLDRVSRNLSHEYTKEQTDYLQQKIHYRRQLANFRLKQEQQLNKMENLEQQISLLEVCKMENVEEYFNALVKRCDLEKDLNGRKIPIDLLQEYGEKLTKMYKDIEKEKRKIIKKYATSEDDKQYLKEINEQVEGEEYSDDDQEEEEQQKQIDNKEKNGEIKEEENEGDQEEENGGKEKEVTEQDNNDNQKEQVKQINSEDKKEEDKKEDDKKEEDKKENEKNEDKKNVDEKNEDKKNEDKKNVDEKNEDKKEDENTQNKKEDENTQDKKEDENTQDKTEYENTQKKEEQKSEEEQKNKKEIEELEKEKKEIEKEMKTKEEQEKENEEEEQNVNMDISKGQLANMPNDLTESIQQDTVKLEGTEAVKQQDNIKSAMKDLRRKQKNDSHKMGYYVQNIIVSQNQKERKEAIENYLNEKKKKKNHLLRTKTKEKLDIVFNSITDGKNVDDLDKKRIQKINEIFDLQSQSYFNFYTKLHDYQCEDLQYNEAMVSIRKALEYTDQKSCVNQGQARLLKLLWQQKQMLGNESEQKLLQLNLYTQTFKQKFAEDKEGNSYFNRKSKNSISISLYGQGYVAVDTQNQQVANRNIVFLIAHCQQALDKDDETVQFAFKINEGQFSFGGVGICQVAKIEKNDYHIRNKYLLRSGHGLYMITPNGCCINSTNSEENFNKQSSFHYGPSDIVICELDFKKQTLTFTKDGSDKSTTLNLKLDSSKEYAVSVALTPNPMDNVKIISDMDSLYLYRTERKKLFEIMEEQMYIMSNQIGDHTLKYQNLRKEVAQIYYQAGLLEESKQKVLEAIDFEQAIYDKCQNQEVKFYVDQLKSNLEIIQRRIDNQ